MNIIRIDPPIPLNTKRGPALAHFLVDYGVETDALWVCFGGDGQIWWCPNQDVRAQRNISFGRVNPEKP